jgi:DNA-cytosine methyltransferase
MKHGSLFSGIGGFDLAAEWMGWENIFHCEINEFGRKVLHHYWPEAISYEDITKTDFTKHYGTIDIISGGFPCQPYSTAGKRLGKEDERHLWPEMLRAIREISPRFIVGENVRGLTNWNGGVVFDEVQADLETEGYEVLPFLLPACAINAPHRRDRIWFIAHATCDGHGNQLGESGREKKKMQREEQREERNEVFRKWNGSNIKGINAKRIIANAERFRQQGQGGPKDPAIQRRMKIGKKVGLTQMVDGQLNPLFVLEMMGFPPDWTQIPFLIQTGVKRA